MTTDELNKIKKEIELDLMINDENVLSKSLQIPHIYQKYLSVFIKESFILKKMKIELDIMYGDRFKYLREQNSRKLTQGDTECYIMSEESYQKKNLEYQFQELICRFLEEITQKIKNLSFDIKNYVELKIFLGGGKG